MKRHLKLIVLMFHLLYLRIGNFLPSVINDPKALAFLHFDNLSEYAKFRILGGDSIFEKFIDPDMNPIIVLGGYKGDSVARYLKACHNDIWVVEPIPEFFYELKSRFEGNERVHLCHYALGKENTTVRLHYSGDATSSFLQAENSVYVPAVTWETFLGLNNLSEKQINFVEMNIEGAEFELLESIILSEAILLVSTLVVQFHKVEELSPYKKELLRNSLRMTHDSVMNFEWVWEVWQIKV